MFLKHHWIYPNEAEGADLLVEMFRPLLSGGSAKSITVNKIWTADITYVHTQEGFLYFAFLLDVLQEGGGLVDGQSTCGRSSW